MPPTSKSTCKRKKKRPASLNTLVALNRRVFVLGMLPTRSNNNIKSIINNSRDGRFSGKF